MQNELEQKIRKAIPELNELGVGCEISGVNGDFHQFGETVIVLNHTIETDYVKTDILECYSTDKCSPRFFKTKIKYDTYNVSIIGKPIQLNHVLEYLFHHRNYSPIDADIVHLLESYEYLKPFNNQTERLIKFINEL